MKILLDHTLASYGSPAIYSGIEAYQHNPKLMSTFDTFDKVNPDLYIADSEMLTDGIIKNLAERPGLQVYIIVRYEGENTKKYRSKFNQLFGNLYQWGDYENFGDVLEFRNPEYKEKYKADIVCIDTVLNHTINDIAFPDKYIYRIISPSFIKHNNYCGSVRPDIRKNILKSSKVCLTLGEHYYSAALCDSYPIIVEDGADILNKINKDNSKEIKAIKETIWNGKTNFHALSNILSKVNMDKEAKIINEKLKELL